MSSDIYGRRTAYLAAILRPLAALSVLLVLPLLSACVTAEGTNAMVDPGTFEREVMTSTLQGLDIVPQEQKPVSNERRAPLVLPKQTAQLPAPVKPGGPGCAARRFRQSADHTPPACPTPICSACATPASSTCARSTAGR